MGVSFLTVRGEVHSCQGDKARMNHGMNELELMNQFRSIANTGMDDYTEKYFQIHAYVGVSETFYFHL